jgi:hypothetical protein
VAGEKSERGRAKRSRGDAASRTDATAAVVARRLYGQRLLGEPFATPAHAVRALGAVQAQDFGNAKWSVARRTAGATDADLDRAYATGSIVRTHVLRPTWHFVAAGDLRLLLAATAPRVLARNARRYRELGLDAATLRRTEDLLTAALEAGDALTRRELGERVAAGGVAVDGQRLPYILMHAELQGLVCSGPPKGAQHTYALLERRVPAGPTPARVEALAQLALRFFTGHGPATPKDFAGWASLTLAEVGGALEAAGSALREEVIDGRSFWSSVHPADLPSTAPDTSTTAGPGASWPLEIPSPTVHLIQGYDEYVMGYSESRGVLARPGGPWKPATPPAGALVVLLDGRVAGFWRRTVRRRSVAIEADLLEALDRPRREALEAEASRYAAFLGGLDVELTVTSSTG